jgi:two-component system cell cycle sensor histidine kinase/response regulator CckA
VDTLPERLVHGQGQTILLVEDEDIARQALAEGLTLINYQVAPASNGREALEVLHRRAGQVDLVLSDVVMPEMGGPALLNQMRMAGWRTPVIFMTGHPLPAEDLSVDEKPLIWLQKPPRLKQLAHILAQALR